MGRTCGACGLYGERPNWERRGGSPPAHRKGASQRNTALLDCDDRFGAGAGWASARLRPRRTSACDALLDGAFSTTGTPALLAALTAPGSSGMKWVSFICNASS